MHFGFFYGVIEDVPENSPQNTSKSKLWDLNKFREEAVFEVALKAALIHAFVSAHEWAEGFNELLILERILCCSWRHI